MTARLFIQIQATRRCGFPLALEAGPATGIRERRAVPERNPYCSTYGMVLVGNFLGDRRRLLAMDLGLFQRKAHEVKLSEAVQSTSLRVALGLLFCLGIYLGWIGGYDTRTVVKLAWNFSPATWLR